MPYWSAYRFAAARSLRSSSASRRGPYPGVSRWMRHPSFSGPGVDRVEAELVEQVRHRGLGVAIVAGDDQRATVLRARRPSVGGQLRGVDMVERLDDLRRRQVRLQQLGRGRRLVVELGNVAVPLRVVVVGVDHDLPRERRDRHVPIVPERHGHHHEVAGLRRIHGRRGARLRPELGDERGQRFRPARVADHHVVAAGDGQPRNLAADVSGADESDGHDGNIDLNPGGVEPGPCRAVRAASRPAAQGYRRRASASAG